MNRFFSAVKEFFAWRQSNFWSGWAAGVSGYFIAASVKTPDNELLYLGLFVCLLATWLLKERKNESIRDSGYKTGGSFDILPKPRPDLPEGKARYWA